MKGLFPPGPKRHLLTGNSREFYKDQLGFLTNSAREFGDVVRFRFFHVTVYLLNNTADIEQVFSNRNFIKPMSLRLPLQRRIFGNGLLSSEGESWLRQRRLTQPAFHRDLLAVYATVMTDCANKTLVNWQAADVRDIYAEMRTLALEIAAKCFFSVDLNSDRAIVSNACNTITKLFARQGSVRWVLDNVLPTPNHLRFRKAINDLDKVVFRLISQRRKDDRQSDDLLSLLLTAHDDDGSQLNDRQLRDELTTLFFASHEAVALVLTWTCYLLALHPEVQESVVDELHSVLGARQSLQAADLPLLRYTRMVITEAMRLYPPNRSVGRQALNDCEIADYDVPAGTQLLMSQWVMHHDPRHFDCPEEFKPERWTTDFTKQLPKFAYFPFGGGARACIGKDFALMEAMLVIASILQRFKLDLVNEERVEPRPVVLLRPASQIKIRLERRQ
jgi:cytochrome P450